MGIGELRLEYITAGLHEGDVAPDPLAQFERWLAQAVAAGLVEPNAMVLATAGADGQPSSRAVLLKGIEDGAFVFFTNRESRKGRELAANPAAALTFLWTALARQVCVRGRVEAVDDERSSAYFVTRPRGSQLGAWASAQSCPLHDRAELEHRLAEAEARFAGREVPRPPYWGGYRVVPDTVELWQGRPNRLHDRLLYERAGAGWSLTRLAP